MIKLNISNSVLLDILFFLTVILLFLIGISYYFLITEIDRSFEDDDDSEFVEFESKDIDDDTVITKRGR